MGTLLRKELLEQWRSYRLILTATVLVAFGILGPISAKYLPVLLANMAEVPEGLAGILPQPDASMAVTEYIDNIVQFGVILGILVPMAAVVAEKSSGTAEITLSKPVSRAVFLLAKFLAYTLAFTLGVSLAALAGYTYTGYLFTWLSLPGFLAANGLILLYLVLFVSVTLLASTLARTQLAAAGSAFGALLVLGLLGSIPSMVPYLPSALVGWARALALDAAVEPQWRAMGVSLGLIALALIAAWASFRRQEI
jgi:ABC-2 type transport system permease protein